MGACAAAPTQAPTPSLASDVESPPAPVASASHVVPTGGSLIPDPRTPDLIQFESASSLYTGPTRESAVLTEIPAGQGGFVLSIQPENGWLRVEAPVAGSVEFVFGWIPTEANGGPQVRPIGGAAECPPLSTSLGFFHPETQRVCAGEQQLELRGQVSELPVANRLYVGSPDWLAQVPAIYLSGIGEMRGGLPIHIPPDLLGTVSVGDSVLVVGHYNDARAAMCQREPTAPDLLLESEAEQELWCLQQFVVESVQQISE